MLYIALVLLVTFVGLQVLAADVASCVIKESDHPRDPAPSRANNPKSSATH